MLCLGREDVFLFLCKYFHNLEQLSRTVVVNVEEVVEAAAESGVDSEQVVHFGAVSGSNDNELATVVFHSLHQFFQSLCALIVALASLTERCQCVGLVDKKNAAHCLVAQPVNHFGCLALIGADHLGTVDFNDMPAVQIADSGQDFAEFSCNGGLSCTRITCEDNVHGHFLLFSKTSLCPLNTVLYRVGNFADGLFHFVHADEVIQIAEDVVQRALFGYVASDVVFLDLRCLGTTANERREDVFGRFHGHMGIAESIVLYLYLVLVEAQ